MDKNNPEIYAERTLNCDQETYEERYGEILTDSFEEGKPLSFKAGVRTYQEELIVEDNERQATGKISFENYPLLNLLDAQPTQSEIYYYEAASYDRTEESIGKMKKARCEKLRSYFETRSDGVTLFSYKRIKEIRTYSYLGKEEGVMKKLQSPVYAFAFFSNYVREMKKGRTPIVFSIDSGGIKLDEKALGFKNIPAFVDGIEFEEGNIVF